eukprot:SAG11_NODE_6252_length_1352_cov_1.470072_2_plen_183_part_00
MVSAWCLETEPLRPACQLRRLDTARMPAAPVSQGKRTVKYEEMLPHEIASARKQRPIAYLPIGTLEWHGVHNAVGLDALKARAICVRAAEQFGGLCMPTLWWGEHREIQLVDVNDTAGVAAEMGWDTDKLGAIKDVAAGQEGYMGGKTVMEQAQFYQDLLLHNVLCYKFTSCTRFKACSSMR